jgi:UDP-glucose/GDP-mannose dehydrogenase family, UDP binding domain
VPLLPPRGDLPEPLRVMVSRWSRGRRRRSPTARRSVEESAALALAQRLGRAGHPLIAYDPIATDAARGVLGEHVDYAGSVAECIERADALLIAIHARSSRR